MRIRGMNLNDLRVLRFRVMIASVKGLVFKGSVLDLISNQITYSPKDESSTHEPPELSIMFGVPAGWYRAMCHIEGDEIVMHSEAKPIGTDPWRHYGYTKNTLHGDHRC